MEARKILTALVSCLMVTGIGGTDFSLADSSRASSDGIGMRAGDFTLISSQAFWPSCGCPDIAYTKTFQSAGLEYVSSLEFAAAVRAVANGASEYSPADIPSDWRVAAENWVEYVQLAPDWESDALSPTATFQLRGGEELKFPKGKYACKPDLVHLASLEYMKSQGRQELTPVSPRLVHAATKELEEIVAAKRQMARRLAARAAAIGLKIAEAERLGAGNCIPGGVARAKMELERALIEARMIRSTVPETVSSFDRAERYADYMMEKRRFASLRGGGCE